MSDLQQAEDKANELIQRFGIKNPSVPVNEIAMKLGLNVKGDDFRGWRIRLQSQS